MSEKIKNGRLVGEKPYYDFSDIGFGAREEMVMGDIDGFFEFRGDYFIFAEGKGKNGDFSYSNGQGRAMLNLSSRLCEGGATCLLIAFQHFDNPPVNDSGHIKANECPVVYVNFNRDVVDLKVLKDTMELLGREFNVRNVIDYYGKISMRNHPDLFPIFKNSTNNKTK